MFSKKISRISILKNLSLQILNCPRPPDSGYLSDSNKTVEENIETLWPVLTRQPDKKADH